MKVTLTLELFEPEDVDPVHASGMTEEAYMRLGDILANAGFGIEDGPHAEPEE